MQKLTLSLLVLLIAACADATGSDGREHNITGSAPATGAEVYAVARRWFTANADTAFDGMNRIYGYVSAGTDRRIALQIDLTPMTGRTAYRIHTHTERLVSGTTYEQQDTNLGEAVRLGDSLNSALSCASAKWLLCP